MSKVIAAETDGSFTASIGLPDLVHPRNIPKDIFFKHKRYVHKTLRLIPPAEARSQSVRPPEKHLRVEKDFSLKYEDMYKNNAARLREKRDSLSSPFTADKSPSIRARRSLATSIATPGKSDLNCLAGNYTPTPSQSSALVKQTQQKLPTKKENKQGLYIKLRRAVLVPSSMKKVQRKVYALSRELLNSRKRSSSLCPTYQ